MGHTFGFRIYIRLHPRWRVSPQGRQQSPSLEINLVYNAEHCHPHDNIVGSHLCDECMKSTLPIFCRMLEFIWCLVLQVCSQTIKCLVSQFVQGTSIFFRQFVSILVIILARISSSSCLNWWPSKQGLETLCKVAPHSCLLVHSIAQRMFEHVLPCHRTTPEFSREAFPSR